MTLETKHCNGCDTDKELTEFYIRKTGNCIGKPFTPCKECMKIAGKHWSVVNKELIKIQRKARRKANPEKANKQSRDASYRKGVKPASENKSCPVYLGVIVAEQLLSTFFRNITRMPYGNPGYDFLCGLNYEIDVKSACRFYPKNSRNARWLFHIHENKIAKFFLCIAFDDRKSLTPEHVWFIPANVVNSKICISIGEHTLEKWSQFERPLKSVLECCNKMKGGK
jgi:hypothetical protein